MNKNNGDSNEWRFLNEIGNDKILDFCPKTQVQEAENALKYRHSGQQPFFGQLNNNFTGGGQVSYEFGGRSSLWLKQNAVLISVNPRLKKAVSF